MLVCALMLTVGLTATFAIESKNLTAQVISSFKKDFAGVQEVAWQDSKDYARATFKMNDQVMYAYYSKDGELQAVTRNITTAQLPISLQAEVRKTYTEYWVTDLFEIAAGGNTTYYITLQDGVQKIVLKSLGSNGWETFRKEKISIQ